MRGDGPVLYSHDAPKTTNWRPESDGCRATTPSRKSAEWTATVSSSHTASAGSGQKENPTPGGDSQLRTLAAFVQAYSWWKSCGTPSLSAAATERSSRRNCPNPRKDVWKLEPPGPPETYSTSGASLGSRGASDSDRV